MSKKPVNAEAAKEAEGKMKATLDKIEAVWLDNGKNKYIAGGDSISVADIFAVVEMDQPIMAGYGQPYYCTWRPFSSLTKF